MLPRNLTLILTAVVVSFACYLLDQRTRTAMMVGDALDLIDAFYVEPVDRRTLLIAAMNGMTSTLDEHSEFIPPRQYTMFQDSIQQHFAGIGIMVSQPVEAQPVRVLTPLVGSPALAAGLLPGDQIIVVDGEDVSALDLETVSSRLKGPIGTPVKLVVRRGDAEIPIDVIRDTIQLESVIGDHRDDDNRWVFRLRDRPEIAYVRVTQFGDRTIDELASVLSQLDAAVTGLVLDLRGNGGGLLTSAVEVSDMFLTSGRIVSTKTRGDQVEEVFDATPGTLVDPSLPVAILIDGQSASASEIVAAALQDHGRAVVVGSRSYGKGTVQNILPLEYGHSALRLTVAKYYRPSDVNIHRGKNATEADPWGVTPDEGLAVTIDDAAMVRLIRLWERAAYPSLDLVALDPSEVDEPTVAPEPTTMLEIDAVLQTAVTALGG